MFRRKTPEPKPFHLDLPQPVWLLLIEVEVTGNSVQPWIAGSRALVQSFVPARRIEDAFAILDTYLPTQELVRSDTLKAERHDQAQEWDELPDAYFREALEQASRMNQCCLGVFIVSKDSAWPHKQVT